MWGIVFMLGGEKEKDEGGIDIGWGMNVNVWIS